MKPPRNNNPSNPTKPTPPEPSTEDQVDISSRVQEGLKKANERSEPEGQRSPSDHKATEFDGSPTPQADEEPRTFKPADDTPAVMPTRHGPKSQE